MRHGETGYVCRAGDAEDFSRRIAEMLRDPRRLADMGSAARRYAEERTWPASLQPVYSLYRLALSAARVTPPAVALPATARAASHV